MKVYSKHKTLSESRHIQSFAQLDLAYQVFACVRWVMAKIKKNIVGGILSWLFQSVSPYWTLHVGYLGMFPVHPTSGQDREENVDFHTNPAFPY